MSETISARPTSQPPMIARVLGTMGGLMIVLETIRATHAIVHADTFGGVSFVGLALPGPLVAVGGPCAATVGVVGAVLAWQGRRLGYAMVLVFSALFVLTHVLDQVDIPGPAVAEIGATSGTFFAWITMFWAFTAVVGVVTASAALWRSRS